MAPLTIAGLATSTAILQVSSTTCYEIISIASIGGQTNIKKAGKLNSAI